MKIFMGQINPTIGDLSGNLEKIFRELDKARKKGAEIVVFPEMAICGYPPQDLVLHESFILAVEKALADVIAKTKGLAVIVGTIRRNLALIEKGLFNTTAIIQDGKLLGFHDKCLLPTYDVFDERRYFTPGDQVKVWDLFGHKVAVLICEDIWQHQGSLTFSHYLRDPVKELVGRNVELLIVPSASPYYYQKKILRLTVSAAAAKTLGCPIAMCSQVGGNDQLVFDGYSMFVDGKGDLCVLGKGFEEDSILIDDTQSLPKITLPDNELEDLFSALVLGVKDYFGKQGFTKACLGLSGGVDSALVACIAVKALGRENVLGLNMPSRYSSEGGITDAQRLAHNLGMKYDTIAIEGLFTTYLKTLQPFFEGEKANVTEENLQARIRGMLLMAFSNKFGYIVLSTGNKSEMAVGYATLYGDMCGGLGVISDVSKMHVYQLCNWINRNREIIPDSIITREPSAELAEGQKDADSLPPYEVIDTILGSYVEEHLSAEKIATTYSIDINLVKEVIHKIHQAEYKRRQAPPGIRVSKRAFSIGRHYPIVQKWTNQ